MKLERRKGRLLAAIAVLGSAAALAWVLVGDDFGPSSDDIRRDDAIVRGNETAPRRIGPSAESSNDGVHAIRTIVGRVVDSAAVPIDRALVRSGDDVQTTGSDGCFEIEVADASVVIEKSGYVTRNLSLVGESANLGDIVLERALLEIVGMVYSASRVPVAGATVRLMKPQPLGPTATSDVVAKLFEDSDDGMLSVLQTTKSDASGRFSFGVASRPESVLIDAEAAGSFGSIWKKVASKGDIVVNIIVEACATVKGRVTSTEGQPIADCLVTALENPMEPVADLSALFAGRRKSRTDKEGYFTIDRMPSRQILVAAEPTTGKRGVRAAMPPFDELLTIVVADDARIEGIVVEKDTGIAVRDARVSCLANGTGDDTALTVECRTDADGRFVLRGLGSAPIAQFSVRHPDFAPVSTTIPGSIGRPPVAVPWGRAAEPLRISLDRGALLEIKVVDGRDAPIENIRLIIGDFGAQSTRHGVSDAEGRIRFDRLTRGKYLVESASQDSVVAAEDALIEIESASCRAKVRLQKSVTMRGRIVDAEARPIAAASAILTETIAYGSLPRYHTCDVGDDGRFAFERVTPGTSVVVTIDESRFVQKRIERDIELAADEIDLGDIVMESGAVIEGIVRDANGSAIPRAEIYLMSAADRPNDGPARTMSDKHGAFEFRRVRCVEHRVVAFSGSHFAAWTSIVATKPDEKTATLTMTLNKAPTLSGIVKDSEGRPIAGAVVTARWAADPTIAGPDGFTAVIPVWIQRSATSHATSTDDGGFTLPKVPIGMPIQLTAWAEGFDAVRTDLFVESEKDIPVKTIVLKETAEKNR